MIFAEASTIAVPVCISDFEPPEPPPAISRSLSPCTSEIFSNGTPSCSLSTCANGVAWPMPKSSVPVVSVTRAVGVERDAGEFLRRRRRDFEKIADAEAAQFAALACFRACAWQNPCRRQARRPAWSARRNRRCHRSRRTRSCAAVRAGGSDCAGAAPCGRCPFRPRRRRPAAPYNSCLRAGRRRDRPRHARCW